MPQSKEYHKQWRADNPEKVKASQKRYAPKKREKYAENPEKYLEAQRKSHAKDPEKRRTTARKTLFGVTKEDFARMLSRQSGLCDVCGNEFSHSKQRFAPSIDHCHTSGVIRGVLCGSCNSLLGHAKDNIDILERASDYLKQFRKNN